MKCPHCGAQIGLEEKYCPFCGLPNEFARKHQEDMDRYEQEFQQTQSEVYQKTRHFTSLTVPLTVIFVLILLNIVSFVFVIRRKFFSGKNHGRIESCTDIVFIVTVVSDGIV